MTPLADATTSSSSGLQTGALLAFAGVLLAAFINQIWSHFREREARRSDTQRAALFDFQDAAFELRQAYVAYEATNPPTDKVTRKLDRATSRVDVMRVRVFEDLPKIKYQNWLKAANAWYLDGESYSDEDLAWKAFQHAIGNALKKSN